MLNDAQEYEVAYKIIKIYCALFTCQTLSEVSDKTKISSKTIRTYLKSSRAKMVLGDERLEAASNRLKEMCTEEKRRAGRKVASMYEPVRNPNNGLFEGVRRKI